MHVCDFRLTKTELAKEFSHVNFDKVLSESDPLSSDSEREPKRQMAERGLRMLEIIKDLPQNNIAVASHSSWLLTLFNCVIECQDESLMKWFNTGELRSVVLSFS